MSGPLMKQMRPLWGRRTSQVSAHPRPRFNVMRRLAGNRPILQVNNLHCEYIDGDDKAHVAPTAEAPKSDLKATVWAYTGRMAGTLPRGSAIVVPQELVGQQIGALQYLEGLGISEGGVRVVGVPGDKHQSVMDLALANVAHMRSQLGDELKGGVLLPFIGSRKATQLADALVLEALPSNARPVNAANNKGLAHERLRAKQIPTPFGHWVRGSADGASARAMRQYRDLLSRYPDRKIFAKLARAASGMGVFPIETEAEMQAFLQDSRAQYQLQDMDMGVLIDSAVDHDKNPNVMIWVGNTRESDILITASHQILVKRKPTDAAPSVHAGNIGPLTEREMDVLMPFVRVIVDWLRSIGFRGKAGLDFLIERDTGMPKFLEVNGRQNGHNAGAFPAIGHHAHMWAANNIAPVPKDTSLASYVAYLTDRNAHYDPATELGVFVANPLTAPAGKMQIGLMAASESQAKDFMGIATGMKEYG